MARISTHPHSSHVHSLSPSRINSHTHLTQPITPSLTYFSILHRQNPPLPINLLTPSHFTRLKSFYTEEHPLHSYSTKEEEALITGSPLIHPLSHLHYSQPTSQPPLPSFTLHFTTSTQSNKK
ncbi:hypothetical protein M6B38_391580 [Iris pallida]|uniref:Uncharacterized protein n=1 Tax=Iris pallida TaxID=29817 RepID=A0AAX6FZA4_IRIPA|nr:hypothetical protein M6B38_391580 [Iris pallida]